MDNQISLNSEELKALSEKFSQFGKNLSEKEQAVMNLILSRASGNENLEKSKAAQKFSNEKESLISLANAIEGKKSASANNNWFFGWTYHF